MNKILIANRGEIAVRIAKTCKRLGYGVITIYSSADADSPHREIGDEAYEIDGVRADDTYLNISEIIRIASEANVDAIHPGYGFLSENHSFASAVTKAGMRFIGPRPKTLELLGDKQKARSFAEKINVPVIPGFQEESSSTARLIKEAKRIGFPVMIKARAGGGGRGMRLVWDEETLPSALAAAEKEAKSFFSDGTLFLERFVSPARHIEVQILGDGSGGVLHFYERDCSVQRKFQKVIEEAPARDLSSTMRKSLYSYALEIGKESQLLGLATVEFLVLSDSDEIFFLEVNPRLQVEHPVTEYITGLDLVELQLRTVFEETLPLSQDEITCKGHAIEARVCAEVPQRNFAPSVGRLTKVNFLNTGPHTRSDHALCEGLSITTHYDSLLAKLVTYGEDFAETSDSLLSQLAEMQIIGIDTNASFLIALLNRMQSKGVPTIDFVQETLSESKEMFASAEVFLAFAATCYALHSTQGPWQSDDAFYTLNAWHSGIISRLPKFSVQISCGTLREDVEIYAEVETKKTESARTSYSIKLNEEEPLIEIATRREEHHLFTSPQHSETKAFILAESKSSQENLVLSLSISGHVFRIRNRSDVQSSEESEEQTSNEVRANTPGTILSIAVKVGEVVKEGQALLSIESMKMEHVLRAPRTARVLSVQVDINSAVSNKELLIELE